MLFSLPPALYRAGTAESIIGTADPGLEETRQDIGING